MVIAVSHDKNEETLEAKARWFLQKPITERLREALRDTALIQKLRQFEIPDDRSAFKTIRVLEQKQS